MAFLVLKIVTSEFLLNEAGYVRVHIYTFCQINYTVYPITRWCIIPFTDRARLTHHRQSGEQRCKSGSFQAPAARPQVNIAFEEVVI